MAEQLQAYSTGHAIKTQSREFKLAGGNTMPIKPSQNVLAASDFTAFNKISAAYFLLKFIEMRSLLIPLIES